MTVERALTRRARALCACAFDADVASHQCPSRHKLPVVEVSSTLGDPAQGRVPLGESGEDYVRLENPTSTTNT